MILGFAEERAVVCQSCDGVNPSGALFCCRCGMPLSRSEGERKHAAVLFSDLAGLTTLAESRDPEQVSDLVQECSVLLGRCVAQEGGTVEQYVGNNLMAVFGVPEAHEDDSHRAVRAALSMLEALHVFNLSRTTDLPTPLLVHTGIATGLVVVAHSLTRRRRSTTVFGDTVNTANRLCLAAGAGQLLVCDRTFRRVSAAFRTSAKIKVKVKGKREPVPAHPVLAVKRVARSRGIARLRSRMVGREREMALLRRAWSAVRSGKSRVVTIVGDAGIGKSRLVHEISGYLEKNGGPVYRGFCDISSKDRALVPIARLFREVLDIRETDTPRRVRNVVKRRMKGPLDVFVGATSLLLSGEGDSHGEHVDRQYIALIEQAVVKVVRRCSLDGPLCVVFEDLHWADRTSLGIIEGLAGGLAGVPVLLLCVARPEFSPPYNGDAKKLNLNRLDHVNGRRLLSGLLGRRYPGELENLVLARAEGNPFYIEEFIRSLLDEGLLLKRNRRWTLTKQVEHLDVPLSLRSLIASRIDNVDPITKALLQLAATIGRRFSAEILGVIVEYPERLEEDLKFLTQMELLVSSDGRVYSFKHDLTWEVAYESILNKHKKVLHHRVGEIIEKRFPELAESDPQAMANHFCIGEEWKRALPYLERSARVAFNRLHNNVALERFNRGLDVVAKIESTREVHRLRARLLIGKLRVLFGLAKREEAVKTLDEAIRFCRMQRLRVCRAEALVEQSSIFRDLDDYDSAIGAAKTARRILYGTGEYDIIADSYRLEGASYWLTGAHVKAARANAKALHLYERTGNDMGQAQVLNNMGLIEHSEDNYEEAVSLLRRSLTIRKRLRDLDAVAKSYNNLGRTLRALGDLSGAVRYNRRAVRIWSRIGHHKFEASSRTNLGIVLLLRGEFHAAHYELNRAFELRANHGLPRDLASAHGNLATLYMYRGEYNLALRNYRKARDIAIKTGWRSDIAKFWVGIGSVYAELRQVKEAEQAFEKAKEMLLGVEGRGFDWESRNALVKLYVAVGRIEEARTAAQPLLEWTKAQDREMFHAEADRLEGLLQAAEGDLDGAVSFFHRSETVLLRLGYQVVCGELLETWGELMCAGGRRSEGRRKLRQAMRLFYKLGAPKRAEIIEHKIRTCG
jgi:class 3 adenylate cyclase/tetratricopeptide (TPR) repeat protein